MAKRFFWQLAATVCLLAVACTSRHGLSPTGAIEGKALFRKERVAGALVTATRELGVSGREESKTIRADDEGVFTMDLPPGSYYLSYRAKEGLYGFFGGNPVSVVAGRTSSVILRGVEWGPEKITRGGATSIEGLATIDGHPLSGATVRVYLDASENFRGPGYAMARTDPSGRFALELPPGRYFVVGRLRKSPDRAGPLKVGDLYAFYPRNPIYLKKNETVAIELPFLAVEKEPSEALLKATRGSLVSGTVVDGRGRPVRGVYACLYLAPEPMGKPAYASEATDDSGRFSIRVTAPGEYYMIVRRSIGQPLELDEYVAFYDGPGGHRLVVEEERDRNGLRIVWGDR